MTTAYKFGTILKDLRRLRGLTQEELAQRTNRSVDAVSQWERSINWPNFETLARLSEALDVPIRTFFDQSDKERSDERLKMDTEARMLLDMLSDRDLSIAIEQIRALTKRK